MWFMLILSAICLVSSIVLAIIEEDGDFVFFGILVVVLVSLVWGTIAMIGGAGFSADEVFQTEEQSICALNDSAGSEGQFFLGSGSVNSTLNYWYITKDEDGAKEVHKLDSNGVKIYDQEADNPRIVVKHLQNSNPVVRFFFFTEEIRYEIYIPEGSITSTYNIDLQ